MQILKSIGDRWKKTDQEVFIAAALLNPFVGNIFKPTIEWHNQAGILAIYSRLYTRFFKGEDALNQLFKNITDYYAGRGLFASAGAFCDAAAVEAKKEVCFKVMVYILITNILL